MGVLSSSRKIELGALLLFLYLLRRWFRTRTAQSALPLPPGPRGLPIFRNLLDWPATSPWTTFTRWAKEHGDIVYMNIVGVPVVILNSHSTATALLDAKGRIYSDRPPAYFADKMVGWEESFVRMSDGPEVKDARRLFSQEFGSKQGLERTKSCINTKTFRFLRQLLDNPQEEKLLHLIRSLSTAILLDVSYGYQIKDGHDEIVDAAERAMDAFTKNITPGARLVDSFPWLDYLPSWLPGMSFKKDAITIRKLALDAVDLPYLYTQQQMAAGTTSPSFVASRLEDKNYSSEHALKWVSSSIYAGGSETTSSTLAFFFLFMAMHYDAQKRAQAEIDAVITSENRLPDINDRESMPYVCAIIKETLRCGTVAPFGIPHQLRENDTSNGYFIPKGSVVMVNTWCITHDSQIYPQPDVFDPSRFLGENPQLDPHEYTFGYGRRRCPGVRLADDTLFMACARVLASFEISEAVNLNGEKVVMSSDYATGLVTLHPKPFNCCIKTRSEQSEMLIRAWTD